MNTLRLVFFFFAFLFSTQTFAEDVILRLHGSNTVGAQLGPELVERWLKSRGYTETWRQQLAPEETLIKARGDGLPAVAVEIKAHGSSTSFKSLKAGLADVGMSSRPIKDQEVDALRAFGNMRSHAAEYVVGLDGIAVIVNPANPVKQLGTNTIRDIFAGKIRDWSELGGARGPIHVYARDDKSGTYDTFVSLVLGKDNPLVDGARRYESNADLSDDVSRDPLGIGFVGLPYVRQSRALIVADGEAQPIGPGAFTVATEDYALARRLFLYVPEHGGNAYAREFVEFAVSDAGQDAVEDVGFVSQRVIEGRTRVAESAGYPDEYLELVAGAQRLSLNFRFNPGSIKLDNKSLRDLERLVAYLKRPENAGRQVMLLGFSDANEVLPLHAEELSISRVDLVASTLIAQGVDPVRVRGYGSAVPVASNETPVGRNKNRRVEVWVRDNPRALALRASAGSPAR